MSALKRVVQPPIGASEMRPSTTFLLLAQYSGRAVLPFEEVCRDFFGDMTPDQLTRKISSGKESLLVTRMGSGRQAPKAVLISDLADYIDRQREAARRELMAGGRL